MTLAAMLDDAAARSPHAVAIHTSAVSLSYADLADRVARVAHGFVSLGLTGQDRVAFLLPNGVELAISILAAAKAGLIAVPLFPTFAPPQVGVHPQAQQRPHARHVAGITRCRDSGGP